MSADGPSEGAGLTLPPLSAAIQRGARALARGAERLAHVGEPRIDLPDAPLESRVQPLSTLDLDPDHLTRLRYGEDPRPLERPDGLRDQLERVTPQFHLRDTWRVTRVATPDALEREWVILRDESWRDQLTWARRGGDSVRVDLTAHSGRSALDEHVAQRQDLMVKTRWHERFGRPDPSEDP